EPLGAGEQDRGRNEERLDAHVVETRDCAGGVVCVQSREDLVAGKRGFYGDIGSLVVANFTDHHDVRILTKNGAEGVGEAQTDVGFDGDLIDAGELVLDRVFDGHDVVFRTVELREHRIERGRF